MKRFIAYYRVSTQKQKQSGLGLEGQRQTVNNYVQSEDGVILDEFSDTESGNNNNRPALTSAIERCKLTNSILVIAKLDRLSRNVAFLASLIESDINFVCCDNPTANKLTIHILAAVAEEERRLISERTKQALKQAKKRGVRLGTNNLPNSDKHSALHARQSNIEKASKFNSQILKLLQDVNHLSMRKQASYLNERNIKTRRNCNWSPSSISRLYLASKVPLLPQ